MNIGQTDPNVESVGILVDADTPDEAGSIADVRMCWEILPAYGRGSSFRRTEGDPLLINGPEMSGGHEALYRMWHAQQKEYQEMLCIVADALEGEAFQSVDPQPPPALMHDIEFRSACLGLGALAGPPVRLYDEAGLGILWHSNLAEILDDGGTIYLVEYRVRRY